MTAEPKDKTVFITCGHHLCGVTGTSFFCRVSGPSLRGRVRSSVIQERQSRVAAPPRWEELIEAVQASVQDTSQSGPLGGALSISSWSEADPREAGFVEKLQISPLQEAATFQDSYWITGTSGHPVNLCVVSFWCLAPFSLLCWYAESAVGRVIKAFKRSSAEHRRSEIRTAMFQILHAFVLLNSHFILHVVCIILKVNLIIF